MRRRQIICWHSLSNTSFFEWKVTKRTLNTRHDQENFQVSASRSSAYVSYWRSKFSGQWDYIVVIRIKMWLWKLKNDLEGANKLRLIKTKIVLRPIKLNCQKNEKINDFLEILMWKNINSNNVISLGILLTYAKIFNLIFLT